MRPSNAVAYCNSALSRDKLASVPGNLYLICNKISTDILPSLHIGRNELSRVKWLQTGSELVTGFTGLLQLVITSNHSAIASSHSLQFTTACTKLLRSGFQQWELLCLPRLRQGRLFHNNLSRLGLSVGRSVKLLLAFARTVILGFRSRRDLWPWFFLQSHSYFHNDRNSLLTNSRFFGSTSWGK
jgi:hypothetical protein